MYYPFKERQYFPLSSFSLGGNLHILKRECKVPLKSQSRPDAAPRLLPGRAPQPCGWWGDEGCGAGSCGSGSAGPHGSAGPRGSTGPRRHTSQITCKRPSRACVSRAGNTNWEIRLSLLSVAIPLRKPFFPAHWSALRGKLLLTVESAL